MSKVFGYTKKDGRDWFNSDPYSETEIEAITDPDGGSNVSLPTAIPSPFARIDLVKTAFKNIARTPTLMMYRTNHAITASMEDEKLVSDTLDLAEILFNIDHLQGRVKILVWNKEQELEKLTSGSPEHRRLAETFSLYFQEDEQAYNFDLLRNFYLIICDHKVIGCTSPVTLFFASGNDLAHANIKLVSNDVSFDTNYTPLYERDEQFQKYLYSFFKAYPVLSQRLRYVQDYLAKNLTILNEKKPKLYDEIKRLQPESYIDNYAELDTGSSNQTVEVLGCTLRKRKIQDIISTVQQSDFIIKSSKFKGGKMPLVLQNNLTKTDFKYANDYWDSKISVPYLETEVNLEKRWLPGLSIRYPYLTVSDFLEPQLIRLIYPIQKEKFFDGNIRVDIGDDSKSYLIPLKPFFFKFFNTDDLISNLAGKPQLDMVQGAAGSVKVTLKIPVKKVGQYIAFERIYYSPTENTLFPADQEKNKGSIVEHQVGMTIYPFIKIDIPEINSNYRIQLIDRDVFGIQKNAVFDLSFFDDKIDHPVPYKAKRTRRSKAVDSATSAYYILDSEFDSIQLKNNAPEGASGFIIPKWTKYRAGNEQYSFAVDFGTTNTHIEYKNSQEGPKPFEINSSDIQIATLFHPDRIDAITRYSADDIYQLIEYEFIPKLIGNNEEYKFPHRTVLAESKSLNIEVVETYTLADLNIPFVYERKENTDRIQSNLKWAKKEDGNKKRVRAYLESLIMLMRNKVLFGNGNLPATRLIWFYPSSMTGGRKGQLENEWKSLFEEYFNAPANVSALTESLAPFYYFKGSNMLTGGYKPVVSIDIGGGTTDVVVFDNNKPLLLTSFKFGANTLFGDAFSEFGAAASNKLIGKYHPHYTKILQGNGYHNLEKVLTSIKEKNRSEDINAFFFSIENNPGVAASKQYSYNYLLSGDEDLKIVFIYFYTAIIYHVAKLMKYRQVVLPKHLLFSGTGSKILNIITPDLNAMNKLSKLIFESVYDRAFDEDGLSIKMEKNMPKEVTCKGGLMAGDHNAELDIEDIKTVLTGMEEDGVEKLRYEDLNEAVKNQVVDHIKTFNLFFSELNEVYSFKKYFNVSDESVRKFKQESVKHIRDYLEEALAYNEKMNESSTGELEETLFFYPLIGIINHLINELADLSTVIH